MEGEILRDALDKIASINKLLGGNKVTLDGVRSLLKGVDKTRTISILDVGCGNGDMLRALWNSTWTCVLAAWHRCQCFYH
jgi:2-polyprenyl-3-methyl-5-hydroxy-6-metoxy-1,4-benzoquinol methylase